MLWSEAMHRADQKALAVGLRDEDGPLDASAALAVMVPFSAWDDLSVEVRQGTVTPETYLLWATGYIEKYRRERVRKKTARLLDSLAAKSAHKVSVDL